MTLEVRLRPDAEDDLFEAASWYETQRQGLGQQFLDSVTATFSKLSTFPLAFPIVHGSIRRALLQQFPFGIFYQVEEQRIVVIAILHGSRHPWTWQRRA